MKLHVFPPSGRVVGCPLGETHLRQEMPRRRRGSP